MDLPESESVSIALHIITAEAEVGDMHSTMLTAKVISEISDLVEENLQIRLDKDSFSYSRFAMHMRHLVQRMIEGKALNGDEGMAAMLRTMHREYPEVYCLRGTDHPLSAGKLRLELYPGRTALPSDAYSPCTGRTGRRGRG